jgi:NAD(P)-dependent dehydrogenase (short-subunit alcohol dehydrogenase family)
VNWKPADLPALAGRTAIVTGGNSGIGFHTAKELAAHGADVVLAVRNVKAGNAAAAKMSGKVRVEQLDLASQRSIREFAGRWDGPIDLLVNNAGLMEPPSWRATEDGHEIQFGTNHLGHFALTGRLLPRLLEAPAPRVVSVASLAHHRGNESVVEGNPEAGYNKGRAYGNSKLANILFARDLQRRASEAGSTLTVTAAHPGVCVTGLVPDPDGWGANPVVRVALPKLMRIALPGASAGAIPSLYAGTAAEPGSYTGPQWLQEVRGPIGPGKLSKHARDEALGKSLWDVSEEKTGVTFAFA